MMVELSIRYPGNGYKWIYRTISLELTSTLTLPELRKIVSVRYGSKAEILFIHESSRPIPLVVRRGPKVAEPPGEGDSV